MSMMKHRIGALAQLSRREERRAVTLARAPWDAAEKAGADLGPRTARQMERKVLEAAVEPGEAGKKAPLRRRAKRQSWIEAYLAQGKLNARQANIAEQLYEAHQGPRKRSAMGAERVDTSGHADLQAMLLDRRRRFRAMWDLVPGHARPAIEVVVLRDECIRHLPGHRGARAEARAIARLQEGLDALADAVERQKRAAQAE